jgi:hypothetical protein
VQQVLVLGRHDGLGGLLGNLLADGVGALVEQAGHVGRLGFGILALGKGLGHTVQHFDIDHL